MSRRFFSLLAASALALGGLALAASDPTEVTVTAEPIDILETEATAELTLTTATAGATAYEQGDLTQTDGLDFSHNNSASQKITAEAVVELGSEESDIDLTVALEGGEGAQTIIENGSAALALDLRTAMAAGGYTLDLIWTVNASTAGTVAGAYVFTATFTSTDDG